MYPYICRYSLGILLGALTLLSLAGCRHERVPSDAALSDDYPPIFPDYIGVTIPSTIAPMDFGIDDAQSMDVTITGADGSMLSVQGDDYCEIPADGWSKMLCASVGDSICFSVSAKSAGSWTTYRPFVMYVSGDSIDYGITYRLIAPGYEVYGQMGIYERRLSDYHQRGILENTQVDGCVNCHSYNRCDPRYMNLHVRGPHGATLLLIDGEMEAYNTKTDQTISSCVYPYWHPTGRYIAYSVNNTHQMVHLAENKKVEVFDLASDVQVYDAKTNRLLLPDVLRREEVWETFPAFSADGRFLYFCAAKAVDMPDSIKSVRYDLCRVSFDAQSGQFGDKVDTIVNASAAGHSVSFPRPSYDGRYLVYTLSDYGNFSIWHREADLWMLDLSTGETRPLASVNSDDTESYHNWSSNSRWLVFASRRGTGEYTRPYICHIDSGGREGRPFLLPQRNPREYYDRLYKSYNIPEFVTQPVPLDRLEAETLLLSPEREQMR